MIRFKTKHNLLKRAVTLALYSIVAATCAAAEWKPAPDSMLTNWGEKIRPDNAWREYPRPALERSSWANLNGLWNHAVTDAELAAAPSKWDGEILVPFAIESSLSGVKKRFEPGQALWYQRSFAVPEAKEGERVLLNFEAVDHQSTVWINGKEAGSHTGGNLPFSFDVTDHLKAGENTLTVRVTDATDTAEAYQLHGKQKLNPGHVWYTPVSGIWQTVWLETVPAVHITSAKITPSISGSVAIALETSRKEDAKATVTASLAGKTVATTTGAPGSLTLTIPEPQLWSPESPTLYDLEIRLGTDVVRSYVGLRETTVVKDANGHLRFALNGKTIFHYGTLDQGWWPDGLLTPPSDAAMRSDIEFLKAAGFNTVRKHIKVEPRRYYTHCDRIGILVWQDQVSHYSPNEATPTSPPWTRLSPDTTDAVWPDKPHAQFMQELETMMDTLHNHPSIVQWVTFNEAWGQHRTMDIGKWAMAHDPSRQINVASGGNFWPVGHIVDSHSYPNPTFPFETGKDGHFDGLVKVVGEFGGHGFLVKGHLWNPEAANWGYGDIPKDKDELLERYKTSLRDLAELMGRGIAAGIYTQTTDVEGEINGLVTYDRKIRKIDADKLKKLSDELLFAPDHPAAAPPAPR